MIWIQPQQLPGRSSSGCTDWFKTGFNRRIVLLFDKPDIPKMVKGIISIAFWNGGRDKETV